MRKEDIEFLKELAHELKTQDNCGTRNPVWCIMDTRKVAKPEGCGDEIKVFDGDTFFSLSYFADYAVENFIKEEEGISDDTIRLKILDCRSTCDLKYVLDLYFAANTDDYKIVDCSEEEFVTEQTAGAFLTLRAAKKHLKENYYHYSANAKAYALSAWRNPELERLLDIIKDTNWEALGTVLNYFHA